MKPPAASPLCEQRWQAVLARDPSADFVYAVKTTGLYCRPSSPYRRPRRENVEFFATAAQAEAAGYRPSQHAAQGAALSALQAECVARACQLIATADSPPSLDELARHAGFSAFHFHRLFKTFTGLTPSAYARSQRASKVRQALSSGVSVTEALYQAGFSSNGRFYENANELLGMTAGDYRAGGDNTCIRFAVGECSLGSILVAQSSRGVCAILLGDDPDQLVQDLQRQFPKAQMIGADRDFERLVAQMVGFVEAPGLGLQLPLDIRGTLFQERVWQALRAIPVGSTASYAEIAAAIGAPRASRAVAQACGANTLAVAIPCHRVVRSDGGLSGYRWGVERKQQLLDRERDR